MRLVWGRLHVDRRFFGGAWAVVKLYLYFLARRIKRGFKHRGEKRETIAFFPHPAGPWYNIWLALQLTDLKIISGPAKADYVFIFDDSTKSDVVSSLPQEIRGKLINHNIDDIGKNYVGVVFEDIFGYSVAVNPTAFHGRGVCKSDLNGTHDGVELSLPIAEADVLPGFSYQRLIDSTFNGTTSEDLRVAYVFGKIAAVFHKHKSLEQRFGTDYLSTDIRLADDVFSVEEQTLIIRFCQKMGLDFGAVDVMRDKYDGKIYIVDVNKTCMPVLSLPMDAQLKSLEWIAEAFADGLNKM